MGERLHIAGVHTAKCCRIGAFLIGITFLMTSMRSFASEPMVTDRLSADASTDQLPADAVTDQLSVDAVTDQLLFDAETDFFGMFPEYSFDTEALRSLILQGKLTEAVSMLWNGLIRAVEMQTDEIRNIFVMVLALGVMAALFSNFADIFSSHQVSELAFYFIFLLMIALLIRVFSNAASTTREILGQLKTFMQLFIPAYILAVGTASGMTSAAAYYQLFLGIVYLIENCYLAFLLPLIYCFILLGVVNGIWMEEKLNLLLELLQKIITGGIKLTLGIITGFGMLQSLISPIVDSLEATALKKMISSIPGIGNLTEGMFEMVAGSAVLIKNSIGIYITFMLLFVCTLPILKILLLSGALKAGAALIGVVSDKRMTNCANRVGDGSLLLLKVAMSAVALFIISVAMVASSTNRGM